MNDFTRRSPGESTNSDGHELFEVPAEVATPATWPICGNLALTIDPRDDTTMELECRREPHHQGDCEPSAVVWRPQTHVQVREVDDKGHEVSRRMQPNQAASLSSRRATVLDAGRAKVSIGSYLNGRRRASVVPSPSRARARAPRRRSARTAAAGANRDGPPEPPPRGGEPPHAESLVPRPAGGRA